MQLPADDKIVMPSATPPIKAKKPAIFMPRCLPPVSFRPPTLKGSNVIARTIRGLTESCRGINTRKTRPR
ncbi:hypothetical protein [Bartonella sp. LJL80]